VKVLVVDDSSTIRFLAKKVVETMGHTAYTAENGAEAMKIVSAEPIDCVLLDWNMPVMDGRETLREIRKKPMCKNTRVIMCTVENDRAEVQKVVQMGIDGYLLKPVTPEHIFTELILQGIPDLRKA